MDVLTVFSLSRDTSRWSNPYPLLWSSALSLGVRHELLQLSVSFECLNCWAAAPMGLSREQLCMVFVFLVINWPSLSPDSSVHFSVSCSGFSYSTRGRLKLEEAMERYGDILLSLTNLIYTKRGTSLINFRFLDGDVSKCSECTSMSQGPKEILK